MKRTRVETVAKVGMYRIVRDEQRKGFLLMDSIGLCYGQGQLSTEQAARLYAMRLLQAENAQRRELSV